MKNYRIIARKVWKCLILGLMVLGVSQARGQAKVKYYVLDTLNTPKADRMWTSYMQGPYTFYDIKCSCMKDGTYPRLYTKKPVVKTEITEKDLLTKDILTLPGLIETIQQMSNSSANFEPAIYMIERENGKIMMYKTIVLIPKRNDIAN